MMKLRTLFRFIVLLLALHNEVMGQFSTDHLLVSIHDDYYAYPPQPPFIVSKTLRKSIQDQTNVAQRLTKQLLLNKDNNFVFSPISIHVILGMIANGANGSYQAEMLKFLNASSIQEVNTLASNVAHLFANGSQLGGPKLSFVNGKYWDNFPQKKWMKDSIMTRSDDYLYEYPPPKPSFTDWKTPRQSVRDQTNVAQRLTKQLLLNQDSNFVFSPLSIHAALSMMAAGAKGSNQAEILNFLRVDSIQELNTLASKVAQLFANGSHLGGPSLAFVNGVWIEKYLPTKPSFKQIMDNAHKADLKQVDFIHKPKEALDEVNSWSDKVTKGLIKSILPEGVVSPVTRFILANALYFKGEWVSEFEEIYTRLLDFHLLNNASSIKAHFMEKESSKESLRVFEDFKVLKLPYKSGKVCCRQFSMYVFLPNAENGLPDLIKRFESDNFIDRHCPDEEVEVSKILLPKFKITSGLEVSEVLGSLGLSPKELTEVVDSIEPLEAPTIFQKAFIEVNEKGTEAVAVTTMVTNGGHDPNAPILEFVADHPFLYLIREEVSGTVMLVGQVLNPAEG